MAIQKSGNRFLAVGGVWIDEIRKDGNVLYNNVLGGSVTFGELLYNLRYRLRAEQCSNDRGSTIRSRPPLKHSPYCECRSRLPGRYCKITSSMGDQAFDQLA